MASKGVWCRSKMKPKALVSFTTTGIIPQRRATRWRIPGKEEFPYRRKVN
jgi:hypothetical protein